MRAYLDHVSTIHTCALPNFDVQFQEDMAAARIAVGRRSWSLFSTAHTRGLQVRRATQWSNDEQSVEKPASENGDLAEEVPNFEASPRGVPVSEISLSSNANAE